MSEEWRPILLGRLALKSHYEVSSEGRVRNGETGLLLKSHFITNRNGDRYERICMRVGGKRTNFYVHRLVAQAFHPNPMQKPEVNHFDTNTLNNSSANLEWATREENEAHKRWMRVTA